MEEVLIPSFQKGGCTSVKRRIRSSTVKRKMMLTLTPFPPIVTGYDRRMGGIAYHKVED